MANILTATGLKNIYFYMLIILLVAVGALYLIFVREPGIRENLEGHSFFLNYSAFQNSIYLANMRFIADRSKLDRIDHWVDNDIGLDFNVYGFPIGTDITVGDQKSPRSIENCAQIWRFLMGPFQPELSTKQDDKIYSTALSADDNCVYRSPWVKERQIIYNSTLGKVIFSKINN